MDFGRVETLGAVEGQVDDTFKLAGTPLRIELRTSRNPYAKKAAGERRIQERKKRAAPEYKKRSAPEQKKRSSRK